MLKTKWIVLNLAIVASCGVVSLALAGDFNRGVDWFDEADAATSSATEPTSVEAKPMGPWGFDLSGMDRSVKPGDDFEKYASGKWLARTKIPEDRGRYGGFDMLRDLSDLRVRKLLEDIQHTDAILPAVATPQQADRAKLAGLFASYLDQAEADRKDAAPIRPMLAAIKLIDNRRDMAAFMGKSQGTLAGGSTLFRAGVGTDDKNPEYNTLFISQSGLGLPDREYYLKPIYAEQKKHYQQYVAKMLEMIGWEDPAASAEKIVAFETQVAEAHWTRAENRNRDKTYNPMTLAAMVDYAPGFDWPVFLDSAGVGSAAKFVVVQNTSMPKVARIYNDTPLPTLAAWQAFHVADEAAPLLSSRFADASFEFHGKFMGGAPMQRDRVKRAASFCEGVMGEAVGREYVAKYFPPEAKAKAEALVEDVKTAMRHRIENVQWMSPETKVKALAKMDKFGVKIGYPQKWRDYSMLIVDPHDLFGNAERSRRFEYEYRVSKLGQKVDKLEWGMTPQTVNAYYNDSRNEIVFPAAILQPPFFDPNADAAVNYGGIGAVIGHEITHGFDDQGRKSDGDGVLNDWWTAEDAKKFEAQAARLGAQYEAFDFSAAPGMHINGKTTMGENIADYGGVLNALDAYRIHLHGQPAPVIDGFTGEQRLFLGWAQVWRTLIRDAALKQQLATDPHSPGSIRAFAPLRNVDAWYQAFDIKPGDKEYVAPEDRVRIW
ncbi:MAG TPA: M13-type metalloendopeptidase [Tepidisphaeraceae bacterium]|nr:M13-type metalloendopeptidase [Tepidisphaeraceae bacterium]